MIPAESKGKFVRINGFVEKPTLDNMPSTITSLGRFLLTPDILDFIVLAKPAKNGEVYLPTAIDLMAKQTNVYAYHFEGTRYDLGSKIGFLKANIEFALRDTILYKQLISYLKGNK